MNAFEFDTNEVCLDGHLHEEISVREQRIAKWEERSLSPRIMKKYEMHTVESAGTNTEDMESLNWLSENLSLSKNCYYHITLDVQESLDLLDLDMNCVQTFLPFSFGRCIYLDFDISLPY